MISLSKNHFMKQWKEVTDKAKQKQKTKIQAQFICVARMQARIFIVLFSDFSTFQARQELYDG